MSQTVVLSVVIEREDDVYVATCPELSIASHGDTVEQARIHLREAIEGWLESASQAEINESIPSEVIVETMELAVR